MRKLEREKKRRISVTLPVSVYPRLRRVAVLGSWSDSRAAAVLIASCFGAGEKQTEALLKRVLKTLLRGERWQEQERRKS